MPDRPMLHVARHSAQLEEVAVADIQRAKGVASVEENAAQLDMVQLRPEFRGCSAQQLSQARSLDIALSQTEARDRAEPNARAQLRSTPS